MKKKALKEEQLPEFLDSIEGMRKESKLFTDKNLAISHKISTRLLQLGITQKDFADKLGKTEGEISRALSGMQNLTLRTICAFEEALNFTIINI